MLRAEAALPDTLSGDDIRKAMHPVQLRVYECGEEFELSGVAHVRLVITGDGKGTKMTVLPPFDSGDAHLCLRSAFKAAAIPRFKHGSPPIVVDYPFVWRR